MDILIDAERLRNPHSGLGQFCRWLGHELIRSRPAHARMTFLVPAGQRGVFGTEVAYSAATWWRRVWRDDAFDVWHMTHQDSAFRPAPKARLVLTIQDLNFLERPDYSAAKKARRLASLQRTVNRASTIVTLSHYTAMVVRRHLRAPGVPVRVIYPGNPLAASGAEETPTGAPPAIRALAPPTPFFLSIGALHPRKNLQALLAPLAGFPSVRLVLAGVGGQAHAADLHEHATRLGVVDRVIMPGGVDESVKRWLYDHCLALLFPSLSEGFGLPAVEAMSCGKPVFLSRLTSLPEVGGDVAYYFRSFDPEDMINVIRDGLADFAANAHRAAQLRARAAQFTWVRAAAEHWTVYSSLQAAPPDRSAP